MKISQRPTNHILVKAQCNSEIDSCDFAIVSYDEVWVERMKKRMDTTLHLHEDDSFFSSRYSDYIAEFYRSNDLDVNGILPDGKPWAFIDLDEGEEDSFDKPDSRLECHFMNLYKDGSIAYTALAKNTSDEFWTDDIPLPRILESIQSGTICDDHGEHKQ